MRRKSDGPVCKACLVDGAAARIRVVVAWNLGAEIIGHPERRVVPRGTVRVGHVANGPRQHNEEGEERERDKRSARLVRSPEQCQDGSHCRAASPNSRMRV